MLEVAESLEGAVGVGPVIAGRDAAGWPVYFYEVAYQSGFVLRVPCPKATAKADRQAKALTIFSRLRTATLLRQSGNCVLAHDQESFVGLVRILQSAAISRQAA